MSVHDKDVKIVAEDLMKEDILRAKMWGCDVTCFTTKGCDTDPAAFFGGCAAQCMDELKCPAPFKITPGETLAALDEQTKLAFV